MGATLPALAVTIGVYGLLRPRPAHRNG
jgi:hypothetical protein